MTKWQKLKIFISWSGERSRLLGAALREWLPKVLDSVEIWMSDESIAKGERWYDEIMDGLKNYHIGLMCITPENYNAPWMVFEAGILHASSSSPMICPVIMGMGKDEIEGPFREFQATILDKEDFIKLIISLNEKLRSDCQQNEENIRSKYEKFWPELELKVKEISYTALNAIGCTVNNVIKTLSKTGACEPDIGRHAFFANGFESHQFYNSALELAESRLYIFGRKNRKLFDKEHYDYFKKLKSKLSKGFDLKILFLDPDSPKKVLKQSHKDEKFKKQLEDSIENALSVLKENDLISNDFCRKYNFLRTMQIVVIDNAVAYSPILLDKEGNVRSMTKAPFNILDTSSEYGKELLDNFISKWNDSIPL